MLAATEPGQGAEPVHYRGARHAHRYSHRWGHGCQAGVTVAPARRSIVNKERGRSRPSVRARVIVRTPGQSVLQVPVRSGDRPPGVNTSVQTGGDASTSNTIRSGMGNNPTPGTGDSGCKDRNRQKHFTCDQHKSPIGTIVSYQQGAQRPSHTLNFCLKRRRCARTSMPLKKCHLYREDT